MVTEVQNQTRKTLPIWAIFLDDIGTLLLAAGLFGIFAGEDTLASLPFDLEALAVALIIIGVALMLPLVFVLVQRITGRR